MLNNSQMKQLILVIAVLGILLSCKKSSTSTTGSSSSNNAVNLNSVEQSLVGNWINDSLCTSGITITRYNNPAQDHLYLYNTVMSYPIFFGTWYTSQGDFTMGTFNQNIPWRASNDTLFMTGSTFFKIVSVNTHNLILSLSFTTPVPNYYLHK